ncbi:MAG: ribonuclease Y [Actinobacteria bacterium HGW-Actinobacteria-5]|nr:MAG: ribonuclease Y [Actinobacteria bacterium HGW-Actinobacteria-5]
MNPTVLLTVLVAVLALVTVALVVLFVLLVRGAVPAGRPAGARPATRRGQPGPRRPAPPAPASGPVQPAHDDELRARRQAVDRREELLAEREDRLNRYLEEVHTREAHLDQIAAGLDDREAQLDEAERERVDALAEVAGLSAEDARAELMAHVEKDARLHAAQLTREIESDARRNADATARKIIVTSIQRLAAEQTTESVVATVPLPGDEMKGRIIGREGRNIRAFEQITGVNVLIDDTPESVLLSCFDPVRRETARLTLTELVADGRIHPARIEEVHERSKKRVDELCVRAAEDALIEMGITDLSPGLLPILGSLQYRTSYGQNVLRHLVECGHIAALLAGELGLDIETCRRAAFLHDIGKALTHEAEGSHAKVGADLARRHGEHPDIVHAIEAHHNEIEPRTVEAVLTQAADAISGSRPGARRESLEMYVKRLQRLEDIAKEHAGVDKVFAMQAGREVRVMVAPELVNDAQSQVIARDIAKRVEEELTYPGSIKVTVVRESRAVALAK